jgi:glycine/D-amino acid oxidase-like deaminating enzyme
MRRRDFMKLAAAAAVLPRSAQPSPAGPADAGASSSARSGGRAGWGRDDTYDAAVIGAGVFGSWTAWHLQRAGKRVVLLDAYGPANARASSGGESRVTRLSYGKDEIYTRMALSSLEQWQTLSARAGLPVLHRIGVLVLIGSDDRYLRDSTETIGRVGGRIEELSRAELARRYPQIGLDGISRGHLEPDTGAVMARRAVLTLVQEFVRGGGTYQVGAVAPPKGQRRLEAARTRDGGQVRAGTFVFACGPWLPRVFPDVLRDRIHPTRQEVFFFGVPAGDNRFAAPAFPVWADFSHLDGIVYGMPDLESRGFKIAFDAHGPPADPDSMQRQVSAAQLEAARHYLARRFPGLGRAPLVEGRVCQYENTSNGDFLIDRHPAFDNVWLVGGGSGHGFKHGPAVGEYVSRAVLGRLDRPEARFSLATKKAVQRRSVY